MQQNISADEEQGKMAFAVGVRNKSCRPGTPWRLFCVVGSALVLTLGVVVSVVVVTAARGSKDTSNPAATNQQTTNNNNPSTSTTTTTTPVTPQVCEDGYEDLSTLPNIDFLLSGYDILRGNPLVTSGDQQAGLDPGFMQPIFASSFSQCERTGDRRFAIPDGTQVLSCQGNCRLSFSSSVIETTSQYSGRLAARASASGTVKKLGFKASFSASVDYQNVERETRENSNTVIQSESSCCAYQGSILSFTQPPLHPNFLAGLERLTDEWDDDVYNNFVNTFGTHHVSSVSMGAVWGQQSIMTEDGRTAFRKENLDISAAASASGFGARISASLQTESERQLATTFRQNTRNTVVYSFGVPPPADGDEVAWANTVANTPAPISLELERIDTLALPISEAVLSHLTRAIDSYCNRLENDGFLATCNPIEYETSDWINPEISGISTEPIVCPPGEFITDIVWFEQDFIGMTNADITCSDGSRFFATNNRGGDAFPSVSCPNGYDQMRAWTQTHFSGEGQVNAGLQGIVDFETSCEDSSDSDRATGYTGVASLGDAIFCSGGSQVIGMQFVELDDPDGGIVRSRFLCGGDRSVVHVDDYIISGTLDTGADGFYIDPSGKALTNRNLGQFSPGENVAWRTPTGQPEEDPVEVGRVLFNFLQPSAVTGIFVHSYVSKCNGLDNPARVDFLINDQAYPLETPASSDGLSRHFLNLANEDGDLSTDSVTMIVYATPHAQGFQEHPGRCGTERTYSKVGVSEVQFSSAIA